MKITLLQDQFSKALSIVGRTVSTRSTLPILSNILLTTDNGRLRLTATNLETTIVCWVSAKVEEEGEITLPAKTLTDLVSVLIRAEPVEMETTKNQMVHLRCGKTSANINGISADEFPQIPDVDSSQSIPVKAGILKRVLSQVAFAVAPDQTRPTLTGVLMKIAGDQMVVAATDAFRLSERKLALSQSFPDKSIIIPIRAINELLRAITHEEEMVHIIFSDSRSQVTFKLDHIVITSALIEGSYPDYAPIIPKRYTTRLTLDTGKLVKACKMSAIFAVENEVLRLKVDPPTELSKGSLSISATNKELGDGVSELEATVEGKPLEISLKASYLMGVLGIIDQPQVILEMMTALEPCVIKIQGDSDFIHIIMPMHFGR